MKGPILKGKRIILRSVKLKDAKDYPIWFKDQEVVRFLGNKLLNIKKKAVSDYFRKMLLNKNKIIWAITIKGNKQIGNIALSLDRLNKRVDLGIVIGDKNYWGDGFAPECLGIVADYVFKKLKYERLELTVFKENSRAINAYKKVGFKKEGILRNHIYAWIGEKYHDEYIMSILRSEWLKKNK